jgi:SAM-dependent methyltransferase
MQDSSKNSVDQDLLYILRCPVSGQSLQIDAAGLTTIDGSHRYPVVAGIPCLIPTLIKPTHEGYARRINENLKLRAEKVDISDEAIYSFIEAAIVGTGGNLFRGACLNAGYPIARFPSGFSGDPIVDIGCSWGRWTIGGSQAGHWMIGLDTRLRALLCAQELSRKLVPGRKPSFVLADARMLPFAAESIGGAFSYSVLQHFSKATMVLSLAEIKRVLKYGGRSVIQMPNRRALRSWLVRAQRGFSEGSEFDVRYYSIEELLNLFTRHLGRSQWRVDCFLGLNVHADDRRSVRLPRRLIIDIAEVLRRASETLPFLRRCADSVFVSSVKTDNAAPFVEQCKAVADGIDAGH